MSYIIKRIKEGIKLHLIKNQKYKTDLTSIIITTPLKNKVVTFNTLIPAVIKRGTASIHTQEELNKKLENLYGATFDCGIDKIGDNQIIKFYIESINDRFIKNKNEKVLNESIKLLCEIVFNPLIKEGKFKEEYVETEKYNVKQLIESKIDNKDQYSLDRCIEEMYKNKEYGIYKYGNTEDLKEITSENLYKQYVKLISESKIDIFISGDFDENEIKQLVEENVEIQKLLERTPKYVLNNEETEKKEKVQKVLEIQDKMNVNQGKIVIGLNVECTEKDSRFKAVIYNIILGESATSKLFQNVREKESLAYTAHSTYIRQKNNIYIRCGIEIENYQKALEIIKQQLKDMEEGKFTEEDIENAKKYMISAIKLVKEDQSEEIVYYLGQEISNTNLEFNEYEKMINEVTLEDVKQIAKNMQINTIYFLRD